jgi:hypothetical protein
VTIDSDEEWEEVLKAFEEIDLEGEFGDCDFVVDETGEYDPDMDDEDELEEERRRGARRLRQARYAG